MLDDSSFAIRPDKKTDDDTVYFDIGRAEKIVRSKNGLSIDTTSGQLRILFYCEGLIRFVFQPFGEASLATTAAVITEAKAVDVQFKEEEKQMTLASQELQVEINKEPVRITITDSNGEILLKEGNKGMGTRNREEVICYKEMAADDHFYGFGEKAGYLNKKGDKLIMWNTDVYAPHNPETDPLYQSIPFFLTLNNGRAYGIYFDNSFKTTFDLKSERDCYSFSAEGGALDYYFIAGPDPKDVLRRYSLLTGRMPLPPKWALGYHQSRYSYQTEEEVRELAAGFKERKIPVDAIYFDIHYMDEYRVFTFDRSRFPAPTQLIADLQKQGIKVVPIVDPGIKADPEYHVFREGIENGYFCTYIDGPVYYGDVWPGTSAFPDFINSDVRKWWGGLHRFYSEKGIEGIWNDMNEPAVFNETKTMDVEVIHRHDGTLKTHREMHNLYGLYMSAATYEGMKELLGGKRPFLLTRAGFAGVQRYAAVWTGDNRSFWEHFQMSLPMLMNLGLSGVPFAGADVGGFAYDATGELLTRWTQAGAFMPFFRNHSALESRRQEPWSFGEKYEKIIKKYIELRYQWLPHLYTLFAEAHQTGIPIMRPLFLAYPEDIETYQLNDQFMVGENVLIAPIMQPAARYRAVYFPEGEWVDYWTDEIYGGKAHHLVEAPLDKLPVFIKKGTAVAHGEVRSSTAVPVEKLFIHLYYDENQSTNLSVYDDDGETFAYEVNGYLRRIFSVSYRTEEIIIQWTDEGDYRPPWKELEFAIHCCPFPSLKVVINGEKFTAKKIYDHFVVKYIERR